MTGINNKPGTRWTGRDVEIEKYRHRFATPQWRFHFFSSNFSGFSSISVQFEKSIGIKGVADFPVLPTKRGDFVCSAFHNSHALHHSARTLISIEKA